MDLDDSTFLRYLRARQFDIPKAKVMLEESIKWRNDFGLSGLKDGKWKETIAQENATGKMYVRGFDKSGRPLLYLKPVLSEFLDKNLNKKYFVYHFYNNLNY